MQERFRRGPRLRLGLTVLLVLVPCALGLLATPGSVRPSAVNGGEGVHHTLSVTHQFSPQYDSQTRAQDSLFAVPSDPLLRTAFVTLFLVIVRPRRRSRVLAKEPISPRGPPFSCVSAAMSIPFTRSNGRKKKWDKHTALAMKEWCVLQAEEYVTPFWSNSFAYATTTKWDEK